MKLGVLAVHDRINLDAVRCALPVNHRIVGRTTRAGGQADLVITGPHMPEVADDVPMPRVALHYASHVDEFGEVTRATVWWQHLPGVTWDIVFPVEPETMPGQCRDNVVVAFPR